MRTRDWAWNARLNFDRTRQKITEIHVPAYQDGVGGQGLGNVFYYRKGEALGTFYGFKFEILRRQRNQITAIRVTPPQPASA